MPRTTADDYASCFRTAGFLCLDDLPQTVTQSAQPGDVEGNQAIDFAAHTKTGNDGSRLRVCVGGSVADELWYNMQSLGEMNER